MINSTVPLFCRDKKHDRRKVIPSGSTIHMNCQELPQTVALLGLPSASRAVETALGKGGGGTFVDVLLWIMVKDLKNLPPQFKTPSCFLWGFMWRV